MKIHAEANSFKCMVCGVGFASEALLKNHEPSHAIVEDVAIEEPKITSVQTLVTMTTIQETLFKCYVCGEAFKTEKDCKAHVHVHETATVAILTSDQHETEIETEEAIATMAMDEEPYDVEEDFIELEAAKIVTAPIVVESKQFACDLCGKCFKDDAELRLHGKNHTCEKYKCDICDKRFSILSNFNVHKRIHKRDKPYRCDVCGKSFRLAKSLTVHMVLHSESDSFNCEICDRSFGRSGSLKIHMKSHSTVGDAQMPRPYIDLMCNDDVDDDMDEEEQQLMYEYVEDKPTFCDICGKKFTTRSNGHMRTHKCTKYSTNDDDEEDMENDDDQSSTIDYWNCDWRGACK